MSYREIDQIIRNWADENAAKLFVEWVGAEARFCYFSSVQGECYQISIDPPEAELVKVHVRAIETLDDMEAHLEWKVSVPDLRTTLHTATNTVRECLWNRQPLRQS